MEETTPIAPALLGLGQPKKLAKILQFDLRFMLLVMALVAVTMLWWQDRKALEGRLVALEILSQPNYRMSWSADQAIGPPDSKPGDRTTAWASLGADDQMEWLELAYDQSVRPYKVEIHENYCPGAVVKVTAYDSSGVEQTIWEGKDPLLASGQPGVCMLRVSCHFATNRIRVYLDSEAVPGWNEIDAVGMHYGWGSTQWASHVKASSSFGAYSVPILPSYPSSRRTASTLKDENVQLIKETIKLLESSDLPPESQAALEQLLEKTKFLLGEADITPEP